MGRFARSQSIPSSDRAVRQPSVSARPRFSTDPQLRVRGPQVKASPLKSRSLEQKILQQPINSIKPTQPASRLSSLKRRSRKRIRLATLAVLSLIALSAGWMLGKTVMGPSQIDTPQPVVSMKSAVESGDEDKSASKSDLEAKALDAQEPQSASQGQDSGRDESAQDDNARPNRKASYSNSPRRQVVSANARRGPGIGIVTRPIKAVFKPLKKANPLRLRIW